MRRTTPEERALFVAVLAGHEPVRKPAAKKTPPRQPAGKAKSPSGKTPSGLDANTAKRLRRGEISPAAKLDLHGLTEAAAYRALTNFILAAHKRGDRLVLVVTGKGGVSSDPERPRGILKTMVPRWLEEASLARLIAERRWAHIRHGGEGALYIYLKKPRSSRA
jgi:DNA-nicking Smr family endonuclease